MYLKKRTQLNKAVGGGGMVMRYSNKRNKLKYSCARKREIQEQVSDTNAKLFNTFRECTSPLL